MIPVVSAVGTVMFALGTGLFETAALSLVVPLVPLAIAAPVIAPSAVLPPIAPFDARGPRPPPFISPPRAMVPKEADAMVPTIVDGTLVPLPFNKDRRGEHRIAASRRTIARAAEDQTDIAGIE